MWLLAKPIQKFRGLEKGDAYSNANGQRRQWAKAELLGCRYCKWRRVLGLRFTLSGGGVEGLAFG